MMESNHSQTWASRVKQMNGDSRRNNDRGNGQNHSILRQDMHVSANSTPSMGSQDSQPSQKLGSLHGVFHNVETTPIDFRQEGHLKGTANGRTSRGPSSTVRNQGIISGHVASDSMEPGRFKSRDRQLESLKPQIIMDRRTDQTPRSHHQEHSTEDFRSESVLPLVVQSTANLCHRPQDVPRIHSPLDSWSDRCRSLPSKEPLGTTSSGLDDGSINHHNGNQRQKASSQHQETPKRTMDSAADGNCEESSRSSVNDEPSVELCRGQHSDEDERSSPIQHRAYGETSDLDNSHVCARSGSDRDVSHLPNCIPPVNVQLKPKKQKPHWIDSYIKRCIKAISNEPNATEIVKRLSSPPSQEAKEGVAQYIQSCKQLHLLANADPPPVLIRLLERLWNLKVSIFLFKLHGIDEFVNYTFAMKPLEPFNPRTWRHAGKPFLFATSDTDCECDVWINSKGEWFWGSCESYYYPMMKFADGPDGFKIFLQHRCVQAIKDRGNWIEEEQERWDKRR
eukprot:TRINITY_DN4296_c0_g1_i1.p1 TRINITY_DN4296_c0_g1~~TRINITY_DN4296_c0_g1_i1.p1  ORF type:complete len:508 (+),score=96.76 TRINITY_DN4296_c0_g1_i1:3-1526(+)